MVSILNNLWKTNIKSDYMQGLINSERCLQSIIYYHLRNNLKVDNTVFIEPIFAIDKDIFRPDIIITNKKSIELIIEIKFVPHHYPEYENDIYKLLKISTAAKDSPIDIDIDPLTGKYKNVFRLTKETNYAFAVFGQHDSAATDIDELNNRKVKFPKNFHLLTAQINTKHKKIIFQS